MLALLDQLDDAAVVAWGKAFDWAMPDFTGQTLSTEGGYRQMLLEGNTDADDPSGQRGLYPEGSQGKQAPFSPLAERAPHVVAALAKKA